MRLWRLNRIVLLDRCFCFFFFNDTATTEIYTLSLHDALPILLAERPVKVGDWVVLGDTEGDVRRVNVRATEIQLGDRSEEHTSELQSQSNLVCRLLLEKKKNNTRTAEPERDK